MKSRIFGIKYCGGCNPGYDRLELIDSIKTGLGEQIQWTSFEDSRADKVLIICGCSTQCAEVEHIPQEKRVWIHTPDFDRSSLKE